MKLKKYSIIALAALAFSACDDINKQIYEGGSMTADQLQGVIENLPERADAQFAGMFTMMGEPNACLGGSRPDDYAFVMMCLSNDLEASDAWIDDSGYNWFSTCGEWSSRNANYANPYIRYIAPYKQMKIANDVIRLYPADTEDPTAINRIAQARALRAYDYLWLAPYFQFNYEDNMDKPCVPIVTENTEDPANNPRATVKEVYEQILSDLDYACEKLEDFKPANKNYVSGAVAYGLRARAYLNMGKYAEAAADAQKAIELSGAVPASISEVSTPSFYDIEEHNWIWGYDMTTDMSNTYPYGTCCSWTCSFSANAYAAGAGCYTHINKLLFDKISVNDVRKGWWLDENKHSALLNTITWDGISGDAIAPLKIDDIKEPMGAYTNVKFGMYSGIGSEVNDNDWPLMRVEELILIKAEGLAKSGKAEDAKTILSDFVKTYRDPSYNIAQQLATRSLEDEIWFQRRVELWGEGFGMSDIMRLKKPIVRAHTFVDEGLKEGEPATYPTAFRFNVAYGDLYTLLRFPQTETDNNAAIVNNEGGSQPEPGQNMNLRDGVTD